MSFGHSGTCFADRSTNDSKPLHKTSMWYITVKGKITCSLKEPYRRRTVMPLIKVWCLPEMNQTELKKLRQAILDAMCSVEGVNVKHKNKIKIVFPMDYLALDDDAEEIIIEVTGLFEKRKRTYKVLNALARAICESIHAHLPKSKSKCFVYPFSREWNGFWSHNPKHT